jgi:pimeloyl-ACP methyl ester carboxylesterase
MAAVVTGPRTWRLTVVSIAVLVAWSGAPANAHQARPEEWTPRSDCVDASRPFGVGTLTLDLTDTARDRHLLTTVNYPAAQTGTGVMPACGMFPLVLAGHGSQGSGSSAAEIHAFLTQEGYVLAAPTFPTGFEFGLMAGDVRFVIREVLARSASAGSPLHGLVDRKRIGYIGTSMGGMIGLALYQTCCLAPRIDAVLSKIGMAPGGTYSWRKGPPLLMINGDADMTIPYEAALDAYRHARRPKGMITLAGIGHDLHLQNDPILRDATLGFFAFYLRDRRHGLDQVSAAVDASPIASLRSRW